MHVKVISQRCVLVNLQPLLNSPPFFPAREICDTLNLLGYTLNIASGKLGCPGLSINQIYGFAIAFIELAYARAPTGCTARFAQGDVLPAKRGEALSQAGFVTLCAVKDVLPQVCFRIGVKHFLLLWGNSAL